MGVIRDIFGLGKAVKDVAEVFVVNKTENAEFEHLEHSAALEQFGEEFRRGRGTWFNNVIDGLNRLPRPILALGAVGLFVFAMYNPDGFSRRMAGLNTVPRELWWLLGAIVSFYFGARELHYVRTASQRKRPRILRNKRKAPPDDTDNPAITDWRNDGGER
ncbi:holin family protein [Amylibacter sp. IMCC11727]|uniref:holin family protein n=1 Tax=Amylibacter sp. IMCC11727 TaxID=3039851 RepID=UPI00244E31E7|nr:holin family protein [Amylibacter sp. IMCC11727]WGI20486.1 holin family protein [Amylibacter sp. IMCC11727]